MDNRGGCVRCGMRQNWANSRQSYARMLAAGMPKEGAAKLSPACGVCTTRLIKAWRAGAVDPLEAAAIR